jgi:hypothetical protein
MRGFDSLPEALLQLVQSDFFSYCNRTKFRGSSKPTVGIKSLFSLQFSVRIQVQSDWHGTRPELTGYKSRLLWTASRTASTGDCPSLVLGEV